MQKPTEFESDSNCDYYENKKNKLYFWHDFPAGVPLSESYDEVNEKYSRRIRKMNDKINQSEKILFVWFSHTKLHENKEILSGYEKLKNKFGSKDVFLLIIENSTTESVQMFENDHVLIIHSDTTSHKDNEKYNPTMGNVNRNIKLFKELKLKISFSERVIRFLHAVFYVLAGLLPTKNLRHKIRNNINMFFYHAKL